MAISPIPRSIDECLLTFENWPEDASISAKDLAETGFYYLGEELKVKCYMCHLEVDDWHHGMTALGTHSRRRNNCEIIRAILSTKTSEIQSVNEKWRLQTLEGLTFGSDHDENLCRELAACGFYRFKNTNNIRCAYCGVIIKPKIDSSIMSQHRSLAKQLIKSSILDCLMVRAQCPTNIVIPDRERFPEYREYQSIFERIKSFEGYQERHKVSENFIRERADAGFFLDSKISFYIQYCNVSFLAIKRMRCFQCGNSLSINDKKFYEKYAQYDLAKLHAHFYPTCEWVKEILGSKYVGQVLLDRSKSSNFKFEN
jgi:DNA-directed RNA polymerase subunit N (RpoN/RPB10)